MHTWRLRPPPATSSRRRRIEPCAEPGQALEELRAAVARRERADVRSHDHGVVALHRGQQCNPREYSFPPEVSPSILKASAFPSSSTRTSNGEFAPVPLWPANLDANRLAHEAASAFSKKLGSLEESFLISACGAASTLLAFNAANAAAGKTGGFFDLPNDAALDLQLARAQVGPAKDEFIFDVQGHFIDTPKGNPKGAGGLHQGRVHGQRHRRHGAVLRALRRATPSR